jgi:hypothetical protein
MDEATCIQATKSKSEDNVKSAKMGIIGGGCERRRRRRRRRSEEG